MESLWKILRNKCGMLNILTFIGQLCKVIVRLTDLNQIMLKVRPFCHHGRDD